MKVAVITNQAPPYRLPLFKLLAENIGARFFFLYPPPFTYFKSSGATRESDYDFPSETLSSQWQSWQKVRSGSYDCVISTLSGRVSLPLTYAAARSRRVPFVLWASMWSHPRSLFHALSALPTRYLYRHSDAVVTYGPHVTSYVSRFRDSTEGIYEANQAVDSRLFMRDVSEAEKEETRARYGLGLGLLFLFVGRVSKDKGVDYLAEAWKHVDRSRGEQLVVAGDGPLKQEIGALSGVKAVGHVERERLPALYAISRALILPSVRTRMSLETWGLVANEAMCQSLPVIATTSVGAVAGGLVVDGENGLVVPGRNSGALATAIGQLRDGELAVRLGSQGREDVSTYNFEAMAESFKKAVEYALEG